MKIVWCFAVNSVMMGSGLAADAFAVSVANGIDHPRTGSMHAVKIAGTFAFFQALMPVTGWHMSNTVMEHSQLLRDVIPWIAVILLCCLGIKMICDGRKGVPEEISGQKDLKGVFLLVQAVATSIDALLIGFTISGYRPAEAFACAAVIAAVTFGVCFCGVHWGKRLGLRLAGKASAVSGCILLIIALEHFIRFLS